ncbi:MAG: hypothetical protein M1827_002891 [Pycnora praestabilis]|nr:MAG: hypothetical protein M1827_002891 [Pycnora praestabilis]
MTFFSKPLAGPGYIILNIIRVMNMLGLLSVIAASAVMLVKTFVISRFFFFDAVSHVITLCISMFLIVSELPLFRSYYARNWPLLSPSSGFVTLGIGMIFVGVSILGNLNKAATSEKSLGLAFWRIVISSGIIVIVLGVLNIIASYIFRIKENGATARQVRSHGAVAAKQGLAFSAFPTPQAPSTNSSFKSFALGSRQPTLPSYNSPRPSYHSPNHSRSSSRQQVNPKMPLVISSPVNVNTAQFQKFAKSANVSRPDLLHHPALRGGGGDDVNYEVV